MNDKKLLKKQIKRTSASLDRSISTYHHSKKAISEPERRSMVSLACLGTFGVAFACSYFGKSRHQMFRVGKSIAKVGIKNASVILPLLLKK